jgi:hypothetical protein
MMHLSGREDQTNVRITWVSTRKWRCFRSAAELLEPRALEPSSGKAQRVVDKRKS